MKYSIERLRSSVLMIGLLFVGIVAIHYCKNIMAPDTYHVTCYYTNVIGDEELRDRYDVFAKTDTDITLEAPLIGGYELYDCSVGGAEGSIYNGVVTINGRTASDNVIVTFLYTVPIDNTTAAFDITCLDIYSGNELRESQHYVRDCAQSNTFAIPEIEGMTYLYAVINSPQTSSISENAPLIIDADGYSTYNVNLFYRNSDTRITLAESGETTSSSLIGGESTSWVLPYSAIRTYTKEELSESLTDYGLFIARNELYARHGIVFSNAYLDNYFANKPWYQPLTASAGGRLNSVEMANAQTLLEIERSRNEGDGTQYLDNNYVAKLSTNFRDTVRLQ